MRSATTATRRASEGELVLVACSDGSLANEVRAVVEESGRYSIAEVVSSAEAALRAISFRRNIGAIVVDSELARQLGPAIARRVGTIAVGRNPTPEDLRNALASRMIDMLEPPVSPEALQIALGDAVQRTRSYPRPPGTLVVFAGAKGGCGVSTIVVQLADHLAGHGKSVCVVELGPPAGGVQILVHSSTKRPRVVELLSGGDGVTDEQLLSNASSGDCDFAIIAGPLAEDGRVPDRSAVAKLLWRLETLYEVVLVDAGVGTASDAVASMAKHVALVLSPDWQSLAAGRAFTGPFEDGNRNGSGASPIFILNRSDRADDIQPSDAKKFLKSAASLTVLPACIADQQRGAREGRPREVRNEAWSDAISRLATELGLRA